MNLLQLFNAFLENANNNALSYESDNEIILDLENYAEYAFNGASYAVDSEYLGRFVAEFKNNVNHVYESENERYHAYEAEFADIELEEY